MGPADPGPVPVRPRGRGPARRARRSATAGRRAGRGAGPGAAIARGSDPRAASGARLVGTGRGTQRTDRDGAACRQRVDAIRPAAFGGRDPARTADSASPVHDGPRTGSTSRTRSRATDLSTSSSCRGTSLTSTRGGRRGQGGWFAGWRRSPGSSCSTSVGWACRTGRRMSTSSTGWRTRESCSTPSDRNERRSSE